MPASVGKSKPVVYTFRYKYSVNGGAIGAIPLTGTGNGGDGKLPDNAIITRAWVEPISNMTSAGSATVMLGTADDTDAFIAATAYNNAAFTNAVTALTAAVPQKVDETGGITVVATVATAALTGGEFDVHVEVVRGR